MRTISAIITTHSRPQLLPRAIQSAQLAGADVEVIVVDDASTDETAEVCKQLGGIKYIRLDQNRGVAGARNVGIAVSSGEFITFHDDDDQRFPGSLDRQVELLKQHPEAGMGHARIVLADQQGQPTDQIEPVRLATGDAFWDLLSRPIMGLSAVFRRVCTDRIGLLDESTKGYDDWDLWVRIAEHFEVVALEDPIGLWRRSTPFSGQGSSSSASFVSGLADHQLKLLRLPRAASAPEAKRVRARREFLNNASDWLIWDAALWLKEGAKDYARSNLITALRLNTSRSLRPWTLRLLASTYLSHG